MATGVNQVGGNGGTVTFEDNNHADAGGDGVYSCSDIYNACIAKGLKAADGVTPAVVKLSVYAAALAAISREIYIPLVTLQNGDGTNSNPTTWKDSDLIIDFATGKTYIVSTVGLSVRTTDFGTKIVAAKPTGRSGCDVYFGAAPTWRGNMKVNGSKIRVAGNMVFQPGATGLTAEIVNSLVEATGIVGLGTPAGELSLIYNLDAISLGSGSSGGLTQFNCSNAERLTLAAPNAARVISTGATVSAKDLVIIATATNGADLRHSGVNPWKLMDVIFSGVVPQVELATADIEDWRTWNTKIWDDISKAVMAGKRAQLIDKDNVVVVESLSDSEGLLSFGSGITAGGVMVRRVIGGTTTAWEDRGPFTLVVNDPAFPDYSSAFESYRRTFAWPARNNATGRQPTDLLDIVSLGPPASLPPPNPTDDVPYFQEADLAALLELEGQDVSVAAVTTKGVLRRYTEAMLSGLWNVPILGTGIVVTVKTGSLPDLAIGVTLGTDGRTYKVRETRQIGDGALTEILLAEA